MKNIQIFEFFKYQISQKWPQIDLGGLVRRDQF